MAQPVGLCARPDRPPIGPLRPAQNPSDSRRRPMTPMPRLEGIALRIALRERQVKIKICGMRRQPSVGRRLRKARLQWNLARNAQIDGTTAAVLAEPRRRADLQHVNDNLSTRQLVSHNLGLALNTAKSGNQPQRNPVIQRSRFHRPPRQRNLWYEQMQTPVVTHLGLDQALGFGECSQATRLDQGWRNPEFMQDRRQHRRHQDLNAFLAACLSCRASAWPCRPWRTASSSSASLRTA